MYRAIEGGKSGTRRRALLTQRHRRAAFARRVAEARPSYDSSTSVVMKTMRSFAVGRRQSDDPISEPELVADCFRRCRRPELFNAASVHESRPRCVPSQRGLFPDWTRQRAARSPS